MNFRGPYFGIYWSIQLAKTQITSKEQSNIWSFTNTENENIAIATIEVSAHHLSCLQRSGMPTLVSRAGTEPAHHPFQYNPSRAAGETGGGASTKRGGLQNVSFCKADPAGLPAGGGQGRGRPGHSLIMAIIRQRQTQAA